MKSLVFYSWQSDLPNSTNRGFIETALEKATKTIRNDNSIQVEPVIDRDTAGVPGAPDIASTIFAKIEKANVFVCDISLINQGDKSRLTPNPNVLLELGFAIKALSWNRIVMVMNTAFGEPELLPFDLRMRRVVTYGAPETTADKSSERKILDSKLEAALRTIFEHKKTDAIGEQIQPLSILEETTKAVAEDKSNVASLIRRYMASLVSDLRQISPRYESGTMGEDKLIEALASTQDKVSGFFSLAEKIATSDSPLVGSTALYKAFENLLVNYNPQKNFTNYDMRDGDFFKFLGHEMFIGFIGCLMRENHWLIIANLLQQEFYLENPEDRRPRMVSFEYICQPIDLIEHWNKTLNPRKISPQGELLQSRYANSNSESVMSLSMLKDADFFLYLRSSFREAEESTRWLPPLYPYMDEAPRFLIESTSKRNAENLLAPLGIQKTYEFEAKYVKAIGWLSQWCLHRGAMPSRIGKWWAFKAADFGSR